MLDKIIILNKNQAYMIYDDGRVVGLYSSSNIIKVVETMLLPIGYDGTFAGYSSSMEDTSEIEFKNAA